MRVISESWETATAAALESQLQLYAPAEGESDVRGFEWWLYHHQLQDNATHSKQIGFHQGGVQSIAVSSRGDIAASGGADGVIRLWNIASGEPLGELRGHEKGDINALAFNADGSILVSASNDKTVGIWNVKSHKLLRKLTGHTDWVGSVIFLPDDKTLVSGSADKSIIVWDWPSGQEKRRLLGHADTVRTLAFHRDSSVLFSAAEDKTIRGWDVETGKPTPRLKDGMLKNPQTRWVRRLAFEPDGTTLLGVYFGAPAGPLENDTEALRIGVTRTSGPRECSQRFHSRQLAVADVRIGNGGALYTG